MSNRYITDESAPLFHVYLIKIGAQAVGIVTQAAEGYRFYAVAQACSALETQIFGSAEEAHSAAHALLAHR
jgi:hypothetical protein